MSYTPEPLQTSSSPAIDFVYQLIGASDPNSVPPVKKIKADDVSFTQWACLPNRTYSPSSPSVATLPPGVYGIFSTQSGIMFRQMNINTDSLIELDDTPSQHVVEGIRNFWSKKERYKEHNILFRRGVILSGPPGSGKTASVYILVKELVANGGIVIYVNNPDITAEGLKQLRMFEPDRPLIVIFEDIDEIIARYEEHSVLSLLDGEYQINNVCNIATTNYPDLLGARIINRPSRFDEHIIIGMPNDAARYRYLHHLTVKNPVSEDVLQRWVKDTQNLSIAHLKELVVAVNCLDKDYEGVLARLKSMTKQPKAYKEFGLLNGKTGFGRDDE